MVLASQNTDLVFSYLRLVYPRLELSLKEEFDKFIDGVKTIITSNTNLKPLIDSKLGEIFKLRLSGLKFIFAEGNGNLLKMIDDVIPQFEEMKNDSRLFVLAENILFALRCNRRLINSIVQMEVFNGKEFGSFILNIPDLSYEQFTSSIVLAIPDSEIAQRFVDLTNSCMYIEFVTIAADIIYTHKHNVSDKTINELAFIVADAAQEYFAAASELGILKPRSEKPFTIQTSFDKVFIEEQKQLADLGLDDYATNLLG